MKRDYITLEKEKKRGKKGKEKISLFAQVVYNELAHWYLKSLKPVF